MDTFKVPLRCPSSNLEQHHGNIGSWVHGKTRLGWKNLIPWYFWPEFWDTRRWRSGPRRRSSWSADWWSAEASSGCVCRTAPGRGRRSCAKETKRHHLLVKKTIFKSCYSRMYWCMCIAWSNFLLTIHTGCKNLDFLFQVIVNLLQHNKTHEYILEKASTK